ncbi:MAG: hypothetical protein IIB05_04095 [Bacteroidetes bacterium]|nr:hypothetical protein [Bacteroidota bacterium]
MKEAAEFYLNFLVEDPKSDLLVSGPSISPENSFITPNGERASLCMGPSMDHQIIQDHLLSTAKASELLNAGVTFRHEMLIQSLRLICMRNRFSEKIANIILRILYFRCLLIKYIIDR